MTDSEIILSLGTEEILCQMAEEAAELSQAALKLRRALDGKNPTPKSVRDCCYSLVEEYADMDLCMVHTLLSLKWDINQFFDLEQKILVNKKRRWAMRLEKVQDDKQVQPDV